MYLHSFKEIGLNLMKLQRCAFVRGLLALFATVGRRSPLLLALQRLQHNKKWENNQPTEPIARSSKGEKSKGKEVTGKQERVGACLDIL